MVSAVVRATPKSCFQVTHKQSHASFAINHVCVVSSRHAVQAVRHIGVGVMLQPGGGSLTSTNKSSCGVHGQNHPSEQSSRSCPTSDSKTSLQGRPSICLVPACHNQTLTPFYVKLMNCFRHETQASAQCAGAHGQIRLEGHPLAESAGGAGGSGCTEPGPEGHSPASWGCQHCESRRLQAWQCLCDYAALCHLVLQAKGQCCTSMLSFCHHWLPANIPKTWQTWMSSSAYMVYLLLGPAQMGMQGRA